jgi:Protein of unknown function (DUF4197)
MKRTVITFVFILILILPQATFSDTIDDLFKAVTKTPSASSLDENTVVSGLKEALSVGTGKAVQWVSKENGYFGNEAIKILLPDKIRVAGDVLRKAGFGKDVDAFILAMNRAAEKAAPKAKPVFLDAIHQMTFQDAKRILNAGDTAATDYFQSKTSERLTSAFKPVISKSMNDVGVAKTYKTMTERYVSLVPFANAESLDLDHYVTQKALDGLFRMVGEEEKKIRTNPAARTTEILKSVFGNK